MAREFQVLTRDQAAHFVEKGYVRVKGCLARALAKKWTDEAYTRLGYAPDDRGEVGDFIILHRYMLHTSSNNHSQNVRFMTNPPVVLKEPMNFNRDNPDDFSLIERATLRALGKERYDFRPTAPREERWRVVR